MNRLIEIIDVGDGGYMSRSEHLAYVSIPEEYIIPPKSKYGSLMLTEDCDKIVIERLRGVRYGYVEYRYVNMTTLSKKISKVESNIEKLNKDLEVLRSFQSSTK